MLRVSGVYLDAKALLAGIAMEPYQVWHLGEPRSLQSKRICESSGVSFLASDADFLEFDLQVEEATVFLEEFREPILIMADFVGVENVTLDFGIELREVAIHSDKLTPRFLRAAADARIGVELSHYPISAEQQDGEVG